MYVVNFFGGPGSGKSTTAAGLFYKLKLTKKVKVELVTEYPKDLVYANQLHTMFENQEVLFSEQNYRVQRLIDHVDWAIVDSPILLSAVYPYVVREQHKVRDWPALPEFVAFVKAQFNAYNNINIWLTRPDKYDEYGRHQSLEQAKTIDVAIKTLLDNEQISYYSFKNHEGVVDDVIDLLSCNHGLNLL